MMLNRILLAACLTAGVAAPAITVTQSSFAGEKSKDEAELDRLVAELQKHLQKNLYKAANDDFEAITKLKRVTIPARAFFWAAQASYNLGHIGPTLDRLALASKGGHPAADVDGWLADLKARYGQVNIKKQKKGERDLKPAVAPFAPDEVKSIEFANTMVADDGKFEGWLPVGEYTLGADNKFKVEAGKTVKVKR